MIRHVGARTWPETGAHRRLKHNDMERDAAVRIHLEAIAAEPEAPPDDALKAYADGMIRRDEAIRRVGVREYAGLLVALGDSGLSPPRRIPTLQSTQGKRVAPEPAEK